MSRKKILIVGATTNGNGAVSSIIDTVLSENTDYEFYCVGYGDRQSTDHPTPNIHNITFKDPFVTNIFYRAKDKIYRTVGIENYAVSSLYIFNKLLHLCKEHSFDMIVSASGWFCFTSAAYKIAKIKKIEFRMIYFDPFTNNAFTRNSKLRAKQEHTWLSYASKMFYDVDNDHPETKEFREKQIGFKEPLRKREFKRPKNNHIIYGGFFYTDIRSPDGIYQLGELFRDSDKKIVCFSNLKEKGIFDNLEFKGLVPHDEFVTICEEAFAFIYIGNRGIGAKSSKYLEYISFQKPIIGIDVEPDNDVKKYKYYIDISDAQLKNKLDEISMSELSSYDSTLDYSDRSPKALFDLLFS